MSPKKRIKPKKCKPKKTTTTKRVHKRKLKDALKKKASEKKSSRKSAGKGARSHPSSAHQQKTRGQQQESKRGPGRPSRFELNDDPLKNVPEQLRKFAWRPGQSGNPSGRKQGSVNLTGRLRALLLTPVEKPGKGGAKKKREQQRTFADDMMSLAIQAARKGDYRFFQHIYERMEGKVPEHLVIERAKKMVAQEAEALAMRLVRTASDVAEEVFGPSAAKKYTERLGAAVSEGFKVENGSSRSA